MYYDFYTHFTDALVRKLQLMQNASHVSYQRWQEVALYLNGTQSTLTSKYLDSAMCALTKPPPPPTSQQMLTDIQFLIIQSQMSQNNMQGWDCHDFCQHIYHLLSGKLCLSHGFLQISNKTGRENHCCFPFQTYPFKTVSWIRITKSRSQKLCVMASLQLINQYRIEMQSITIITLLHLHRLSSQMKTIACI